MADVLVMNKAPLADEKTRKDVCPVLNQRQISHVLGMYSPDEFDPGNPKAKVDTFKETVHPGVIASLSFKGDEVLHYSSDFQYPIDTTHTGKLDVQDIKIPDSFLDRPGFCFLVS